MAMTPEQTARHQTEKALGPVLFCLTHEHLRENGYVVREDFDILAKRVLRRSVKGLDPLARKVLLDRAAEEGAGILRAASCSPSSLWVSLAHVVLVLANRGITFDEDLLLMAAGIETDVVDYADQYGGMKNIEKWANKLENEALLRGWWRATEKVH